MLLSQRLDEKINRIAKTVLQYIHTGTKIMSQG